MADFSFLSDSDDEKAVEAILSQAKDQIVLEQVAAINCSGFTDSVLPTHLESRFQKLKSFPASRHKSSFPYTHSSSSSDLPSVAKTPKTESDSISESNSESDSVKKSGSSPSKSLKDDKIAASKKNLDGNVVKKAKSLPKSSEFEAKTECNSESDSETNSADKKSSPPSKALKDDIFSPIKKNPGRNLAKSAKSPYGSASSWDSSTDPSSPPQKSGCFWCSPKKASRKKSGKENNFLGMGFDWEKDDELLADLKSFSGKNQQKLLKKAMKEEEKINKEAEKIVKWAKQASSRMDVSGLEDELSDFENFK